MKEFVIAVLEWLFNYDMEAPATQKEASVTSLFAKLFEEIEKILGIA